MFKIGILSELKDTDIKIAKDIFYIYNYKTKEEIKYDILQFDITGKLNETNYNFLFRINKNIKEFQDYKKLEIINIKDLILDDEFFNNEKSIYHKIIKCELHRCTNNTFNILLIFEFSSDKSLDNNGIVNIEISFNINDYIGKYYESN